MYQRANNQANFGPPQGADLQHPPAHHAQGRPNHRLTQAIMHGQPHDMLQLVNEALAAGADINYCDANGRSRIEIAVGAGNLAALRVLLAKGAQLPIVGADGKDILMLAAANGSADVVAYLVHVARMNPLYSDQFGQTALMYAVKYEHVQAATVLTQTNTDINAATFHEAHHDGTLVFGAETDYSGEDVTALMIAVDTGNKAMVDLLLASGAEVDCGTHESPLSIAAQSADLALLKCLIEKNPDTGRYNKEGLTPLHVAIAAGASADCIAVLLAKTDIEVRTDTRARLTPLGLAISLQQVDTVAMLIEKKAALHSLGNPGVTAWQLSPAGSTAQSDLTDLLVFAIGPRIFNLPTDVAPLFDALIASGSCVRHYDKFGLFSKVTKAIEPLLAFVMNDLRGSPGQQALQAMQHQMRLAHAIATDDALKAAGSLKAADPDAADSLAARCQTRVSNAGIAQANQLTSAAQQRLCEVCLDLLSAPFKALRSKLPDTKGISEASAAELARLLQQDNGLPPALATHIAHCWRDAVASSLKLFDSHNQRQEQQRYLQKLLPLLLSSDLLPEKFAMPGTFEALLTETLIDGAAEATASLNAFLADPPKLLRTIEQRHSLRDVNRETLTSALYLQAGLPPACVTAIVDAWSDSVVAVKNMPGIATTAQIQAALATQFANALSHRTATMPDTGTEPLQALEAEVMAGLSEWCGWKQALEPALAMHATPDHSGNKRSGPDQPEPDSAPKRQRH